MSTLDDSSSVDDDPQNSQAGNKGLHSRSPSPDGCIGVTFERGYYHFDRIFIKRSLRPSEFKTSQRGLHVPRLGKERLQNEAETLRFIQRKTNIPVPTVYGAFDMDDSYYLITEYIRGTPMSQLSDDEKEIVRDEISQHLATLRELKSDTIGGPAGIVIPPYRVMRRTDNDVWPKKSSQTTEYVFCHNDLSQPNIIVDPDTLKIRAIIDWEYAGFFPQYFEAPFYERLGPSVPIGGEKDDVDDLLEFLGQC
ncbi:hypothetical protein N7468_000741 [Penicillium chermesinum]|uniref:Aminoglycoside phosphotransferase domain-containing protein n=1 Tax=Penicillium chermesinum TaxID=63820 RepID=A0A9W9TZM7_9EURO|nr:uncharacterized protein N7468_000741 [Penicillium chermesinum]KAJ5249290.1 hypothetical protein N7468_000741 [Penicillium chermesinum]